MLAQQHRFRSKAHLCALWIALLLPFLPCYAHQSSLAPSKTHASATQIQILSSIAQVRSLSLGEARHALPVRVTGVVTFHNPSWDGFYLQNAQSGIYVYAPHFQDSLKAGQKVEVTGKTDSYLANFSIRAEKVAVIGTSPLPKPSSFTSQTLKTGQIDGQWMRAEGIVLWSSADKEGAYLQMKGPWGPFTANFPSLPLKTAEHLIDSKITLEGVCGVRFGPNNQMNGFDLFVPDFSHLHIQIPASANPFQRPVHLISDVLKIDPQDIWGREIRIQGMALYRSPEGILYLTDGTAGIRVRTRQPFKCSPGESLDIVGHLTKEGSFPLLINATCRRIGRVKRVSPKVLTALEARKSDHEGAFVMLEGRVLDVARQVNEESLLLQQDQVIFDAYLEGTQTLGTVASLPKGSIVSVKGVLVTEAQSQGGVRGFRVLLRSPQDIEVVQTPAWWSLRYVLILLGVFLLLGLAAAGWGALLHRRLRWLERESQLEERYRQLYDNAHEMIYMLDLEGRIVSINRAGEKILGMDQKSLLTMPLQRFIAPASRERFKEWLQAAQKGRLSLGEMEFLTCDGNCIHMEVTTHFVNQDEGAYYWQGIGRDVTERRRLMEVLEVQALHDPLTQLPNRAAFNARLAGALGRLHRSSPGVGLLFLDLDGFKLINDSFGHDVGDQLLVSVAERLSSCLSSGEFLARLGGDEFTVLISSVVHPEYANLIAERILKRLSTPFSIEGQDVYLSTSIGVATSSDIDDALPVDLLRSADTAMYIAKSRGKSCYVVFDPSLETPAKERLEWETELRRAMERGELGVYYQPIVSLESGKLEEMEALVRWNHPRRGLIAAEEFIHLSGEIGLINGISFWALETACRQMSEWQEQMPDQAPRSICVNLSAHQLDHPHLTERIAAILREANLDASRLKIELTEHQTLEMNDRYQSVLGGLRALGVELSLDDFGTGYSSLSYLKRFPISSLKIDKLFTEGLGREKENEAIIRAVIAFAKTLGLTVTAEGIETEEQYHMLRELGCDMGQGFYIAKPHPAQWLSGCRDSLDDLFTSL